MKTVAATMLIVGVVLSSGAALEFAYFGPEARQFWVGVFTTPAGLLFAGAGTMLWQRGSAVRRLVLVSAIIMIAATVAASVLDVMGPPATLMGGVGSLAALTWALTARASTTNPPRHGRGLAND
ncbi:MAG: hypothetical protein H0W08_09940 [Acidobacteria bacterium]|nr:hypothetical protein [Acidobacteriota bacterium]